MSWSDQGTNVGGQTVAVGPTVGCAVACNVAVSCTAAVTEAASVGTADGVAVASSLIVWLCAKLHAWTNKTHNKIGMDALVNIV